MAPVRSVLSVTERNGAIRIHLGGLAHGDGAALQEAANDLLQRVLVYAAAVRQSGFSVSCERGQEAAFAERTVGAGCRETVPSG
jgi:hypothetical protein